MDEKSVKSEVENRSSFVERLIKVGIFLIVSLGLVVCTFFLEGVLAVDADFTVSDNGAFPDDVVVRPEYGDELTGIVESVSSNVLKLSDVHFWVNSALNNKDYLLLADKIAIIPNRAVFDLTYESGKLKLAVYDGDVYLGFLPDEVELNSWHGPYDEVFTNKMLVPRGRQVQFSVNKIDERFDKLLYAKLVKELKYSAIPSSDRDSDWVKNNVQEDAKFVAQVRQDVVSEILHSGTSVNDGSVGRFIFWAEENLTFIPEKKRKIAFAHLFNYLNDAIYHLTNGDESAYLVSMQSYGNYLATLPSDFKDGPEFAEVFDSYLDKLSVFGIEDNEYRAFSDLLLKKFNSERDRFSVVNEAWLDVYSGLNINSVVAEDALNSYYQYFDQTLGGISDGDQYLYYVTFNNQLFDNLFLSSPIFYKDGYFAMKNVLELELVKLYADGQMKDELRQSLINTKLTFLKRLIAYFFDGELEVSETKTILSRLVDEINELMPKGTSEVAVVDLFESELDDIGNFWGYLNSPEYYSSKSYGMTHKTRYQSYLDEKDKIWSFIDIQEEVLGDEVKTLSSADVMAEVTSAFVSVTDITDLDVGSIKDVDQRYVDVDAVVGGYPISGKFDRDTGLIKEVYSYDELVSDRAVQLESLFSILSNKFADLTNEDAVLSGDLDLVSEETYAQRFARNFVAKKVREAGFDVQIDNVSIVDESNAVYRVEKAGVEAKAGVEVTFDFSMTGEVAINLFIVIDNSSVVLDGEYTLDEVLGIASADKTFDSASSSSSSNPDASSAVAEEEAAILKDLSASDGISR